MKKVLLSAVAVFTLGFANAQEVKFGAKAGLNMSSLNSSSSIGDTKSLVGFHVGGLAEIKLNDKMSLQPELLYSQEGGKYEFTDVAFGTVLTGEQEIKLSKINLPIIFKYYVIENLSIEAGPQLDYILSAKSDNVLNVPSNDFKMTNNPNLSNSSSVATFTDTTDGSTSTEVLTQNYGLKKLNFGFNLGAGYKLSNGMFFQTRYTLGLTKFVDNANFLAGTDSYGDKFVDARYDNTSFKSSNLQLSVGYQF